MQCLTCAEADTVAAPLGATGEVTESVPASLPTTDAMPESDAALEPRPVITGTAGASARREHERRVAKHEDRIRKAHPRLGGFILAVRDEPQSSRAWARGARGEELLAKRLDGLADQGVLLLHDRRVPPTRAGITKQVDLIRAAVATTGYTDVPIHGMLCFVEAAWPLIGGSFTTAGIDVLWPKKVTEKITAGGSVTNELAAALHRHLANVFPPA